MKKNIKEVKFKVSGGQQDMIPPNFDDTDQGQTVPETGGTNIPTKTGPLSKRRFKGSTDQQDLVPPNFDSDKVTKPSGKVPYPDMPEVKPCNPKGMRYAKRCPNNAIEKGCGGQNVQDVQVELIRKGFDLPRWKADCKYGDETKSAVTDFQISKGIPNTGVVDQRTYNKLFASTSQPAQPSTRNVQAAPSQGATQQPQNIRRFSSGGGGLVPPVMSENLDLNVFNDVHNLKNRYEQVEKLVFERLVKNAN